MKGIYVHIPFCIKKCNYCDFCSFPNMLSRQGEYVKALNKEASSYKGDAVFADTLYFGGGTPSLLDVKSIESIIETINANFIISPDAEITIEANPATITEAKAKELHSLGINRISLGAQSFIDAELATLGRAHCADDIEKSFAILRQAGFSNISLDLMYALPGQTMHTLSESIQRIIALHPEHISCYGLKIENGTPFYAMLSKGQLIEKSDDEYADMYDMILNELENNGYRQYELSNFSLDGCQSKHNLKYWQGKEYIGLGVSASSLYKNNRFTNTNDYHKYIESFEKTETQSLTKEEQMSEFMFLALRLTSIGASKAEFEKRFGIPIDKAFPDAIHKHTSNGMLKDCGDRYVLAQRAYYVSNSILCDFV